MNNYESMSHWFIRKFTLNDKIIDFFEYLIKRKKLNFTIC